MRTRTLDAPSPESARSLVADSLDDALVTLYGRCEVDYEGRASSYLGPGDRLVVCKPDGTLLVHTDEQRTPVNWQPPGCTHGAAVADGDLVVHSERENPAEEVDIWFERVDAVVAYRAEDARELELSGTEADLRDRVREDPSLVEPGLRVEGAEEPTGAGHCDLLATDAEGRPVVVELKRRRVGPDAASQLERYVSALARDADGEVRGVLVAPSVTDSGRNLLEREGLEFVSLEP